MRSLPLLLLLAPTAGCLHEASLDAPGIAAQTEEPVTEAASVQHIVVGYDGPGSVDGWGPTGGATAGPEEPRAAAAGRVPRDPIFFSLGAGHGALGHVDLEPCRAQGLQLGYVRLRVTFNRSGRVVRAAVESPAPPPSEALACVGRQLEAATVPLFDGGDVTLSKSFFVYPVTADADRPAAPPSPDMVRRGPAASPRTASRRN
jgi:hypothetical protein